MPAEPITSDVWIAASPARVFRYFVEPEALLRWMGDYAKLDARPGGEFAADINGVAVRGEYLELDPPNHLVISWGFAGSDVLPPGASRVEVNLTADGEGTRVALTHSGLPAEQADRHDVGWRHFLDRLAIAASGGDPGPDPWAAGEH